MPGNQTVYTSPRLVLPAIWRENNIPSGQATGVAMGIVGVFFDEFPLIRNATLVSLGVMLSEQVTTGLIRLELTKNGNPTGKTFDLTSSVGTKEIVAIDPGLLVASKGDEVGLLWGSSGNLAPSSVIDIACFLEVQYEGQ